LKWHLQSSFFLIHSATIDFQEAKDSINEEDLRPTSSTWSYITNPKRFDIPSGYSMDKLKDLI